MPLQESNLLDNTVLLEETEKEESIKDTKENREESLGKKRKETTTENRKSIKGAKKASNQKDTEQSQEQEINPNSNEECKQSKASEDNFSSHSDQSTEDSNDQMSEETQSTSSMNTQTPKQSSKKTTPKTPKNPKDTKSTKKPAAKKTIEKNTHKETEDKKKPSLKLTQTHIHDAEERIYNKIREMNEPFNEPEIIPYFKHTENNAIPLPTKTIKESIQNLVQKGLLHLRVLNKLSVYAPVHTEKDNNPDTAELDKEISQLEERLAWLKKNISSSQAQYKTLSTQPPTNALDGLLEMQTRQINALLTRIHEFIPQDSSTNHPSTEELQKTREKLTTTLASLQKERQNRYRIFKSIISEVTEGMGITKKELLEEIGIEPETLPPH
ncbi:hypothetical protein NEOKW01_1664 [Nematocida sp. AWRm80]|nr:hypothetical protein NEOKW01_1664 [Nematocida sp. AWRm80]